MYKILFALVLFVFGLSTAAGQDKIENLSKSDSTKQPIYSESTPYQPRIFEVKETKKKKTSKSKKDNNGNTIIQPVNTISPEIKGGKNIRIPVFVYDRKEHAVTDLQDSEIKLFVDGNEREITALEKVQKPLNILLILDTSPSTAYEKKGLQNFVLKMIEALKPADQLQIIKFNENVTVLTEPTNDVKILEKAVKKIQIGDGTSLYDAIEMIFQKNLSQNQEQPTIILLTDGVDTTSQKTDYITSLLEAEKGSAVVFPFYLNTFETLSNYKTSFPNSGFGINPPRNIGASKAEYDLGLAYLQDIAALSGGRTFAVKKLSEIKKEDFDAAFKFINPQYYISINRAETAAAFQRKQIKVRVNRPNLVVQARGSYIIGEN